MQKNNSENFSISSSLIANSLVVLLILLIATMVLSQANPGLTLPGRDYGIFSYIGQQITLGKLPYSDAWDHKPPAIFYVNALGLWLGRGFRWGIWAIEFVSLAVAGWFSYLLLKKLWGVFPAVMGLVIWLIGLNLTLQGGNTTEEFPLPLHFLALILFLLLAESPKHYMSNFVLGLSFSISFLFRANNAIVETAVVLALLLIWFGRQEIKHIFLALMSMAMGAFFPILAVAYYFWSRGIFKEMFDASITYNLVYSETDLGGVWGGIAGFQRLGFIAWIGLIGCGIVLFLLFNHWRTGTKPSPILLFLLIGCPLALLLTDPPQRNYGHYFINWLPFVALLSGLVFFTLQNHFPIKVKKSKISEFVILTVTLGITFTVFVGSGLAAQNWNSFRQVLGRSDIERRSTVAVYARENTKPGDTVLFWGGFPGENMMADRASPSAYITYPLLLEADLSVEFSDRFFHDLTSTPPALIVDMDYARALSVDPVKRKQQLASDIVWPYLPSNIDDVFEFINQNYHVEMVFRNATVYRLNGASQ